MHWSYIFLNSDHYQEWIFNAKVTLLLCDISSKNVKFLDSIFKSWTLFLKIFLVHNLFITNLPSNQLINDEVELWHTASTPIDSH